MKRELKVLGNIPHLIFGTEGGSRRTGDLRFGQETSTSEVILGQAVSDLLQRHFAV